MTVQTLKEHPGTGRPRLIPNDLTGKGVGALPRLFTLPAWEWVQGGDVGWWVLPEWRARLLDDRGAVRLDEWRSQGRVTVIKSGPHRVVYRADIAGGAVYVKHFLVPGLRSKLRQWFRRGKGRNEAKRAVRLAAVGIPTITPIALGERRIRKFLFDNYLITPAIPGTVPLDEFVESRLDLLPGGERSRVRRALAEDLGVLTGRLHEAGLLHTDFHPGNLLVDGRHGGRPRLAMIDLDALRARKAVTWDEARANLSLLNHYFWIRCDRSDRRRFLRAYLGARGQSPPDPKRFAHEIETATRAWAERLWRRWGRRCRGTNKYFKKQRGPGTWAVAARELDREALQSVLGDPDAPFTATGSVVLKNSRTTTVAEVTLPVDGRPTRVIYKRFNHKKWLDPFLTLFRPSRAWQAWQAGQHLASRAIATPRNLAFVARCWPEGWPWQRRFLPGKTYLVTEKAQPSVTLGDYARVVLPGLPEADRRERTRGLTRSLARLIRMLHERSLSHRDLKSSNILIEGDPSAAGPRLSLIDLVGVRLRHPLPRGRRLQNLMRLHLSLQGHTRTDALRFLRDYGAMRPGSDWKTLWREVEALAAGKVEKNRRNGRELS